MRRRTGVPLWVYPTLFLAAPASLTPTHYIDQAAPGGGSGSLASPLNALPAATTAPDQVYALKAGQTHPGKASVSHERFGLTRYGTGNLPILSALLAPTWVKTATYTSVYDATVSHDAVSAPEGTYDAIYAVEEDTQSSQPVSRFRQMTRVASLALCDSTPGSYYVSVVTSTSTHVYVHASDNAAPGTRYAISVTKKYAAVDVGASIVDVGATGVYLQGSIGGYGTWERGKNTNLHHTIIQFGTIHHAVVHGGVVEDVCYAGTFAVPTSIAHVFYVLDAAQTMTGRLSRALFDRVGNGFYCHTSSGASGDYAAITVSDSVFSGARDASGQLVYEAFNANNAQQVTLRNVVVKDYRSIGLNIRAGVLDRLFVYGYHRGVFYPNTSGQEIVLRDCILITADSGYTDPAEKNSYPVRQGSATGKLRVENCLIIVRHASGFFSRTASTYNMEVKNCVIVSAWPSPVDTPYVATNVDVHSGAGASEYQSDNNAYVAVLSNTMLWNIINRAGSDPNPGFAAWKTESHQDAHSIYLSSSGDMNTLFRDYTAGDLRWATTTIGNQVAATGWGPRFLPVRWPVIPTADDAHEALRTGVPVQV